MNDTETCCNGNCNQGRECVRRTGNTSGSLFIDLLTFYYITIPLWWRRVWPGLFLIGVFIVSAAIVALCIAAVAVALSFVDLSHVYVRPQ